MAKTPVSFSGDLRGVAGGDSELGCLCGKAGTSHLCDGSAHSSGCVVNGSNIIHYPLSVCVCACGAGDSSGSRETPNLRGQDTLRATRGFPWRRHQLGPPQRRGVPRHQAG